MGVGFCFGSDRNGNKALYLMDTAGANISFLTDLYSSYGGLSWSPDGSQIVFTSERDGNMRTVHEWPHAGAIVITRLTATSRRRWPNLDKGRPTALRLCSPLSVTATENCTAVATSGDVITRLTQHPAEDTNPTWTKVPAE